LKTLREAGIKVAYQRIGPILTTPASEVWVMARDKIVLLRLLHLLMARDKIVLLRLLHLFVLFYCRRTFN
jgi:hypothetical protein